MNLSHEISLKSHIVYFEIRIILKNAVKSLKWAFEAAKHFGSHFEKECPKRFYVIFLNYGLEPNFWNLFMVIKWAMVYCMLGFCRGRNAFYSAKHLSFHLHFLYPSVGAFKSSLMPFLLENSIITG